MSILLALSVKPSLPNIALGHLACVSDFAGQLSPCEPTLVDSPPAGPDWAHEIKHDGFRILACKQGERTQV
jgi:ATP-dependent DNA ligase